MALQRVIREPAYALTWAGLSFLIFDVCLYLMVTLTGSRDNMCMVGANLTPENLVFSVLLSLGFGLILTLIFYSFAAHARIGAGTSILGTIGSILGFLTVFCGICSISVISSLFATLGLGYISFAETERFLNPIMEFVVDHNLWIKIACIGMIGMTVYLLDRKMEAGWVCAMPLKRK